MSVSWMATANGCPDWKFGQMVRYTEDPKCLALVLGWDYRVDYNPTESIVVLLLLTPWTKPTPRVGEIIKPYCGWWEPVE